MRIAVVHYHFKPGGVTRVVCHAVESLHPQQVDSAVFAGMIPPDFALRERSKEISALGYSDHCEADPVVLVDELIQSAKNRFEGHGPDLWHVHNHSLGKNQLTHRVVNEMAKRGFPLLLQIHDFAEDGRPSNMMRIKQGCDADHLYPIADHVHYGVLNGRDRNVLLQAGFPASHVHFIPNPVKIHLENAASVDLQANRYFLYPTRSIRRKNIGEVLLWAAGAEEGDRFGLTLAPDNPEAKAIYEEWVTLAERLTLPVDFEIGNQYGFADLLYSADWIMTTSVAEGFGLAFLEPGLIPKPVTGRDLPEITRDFKKEGVSLNTLYESIPVPLEWLDVDRLTQEITTTVKALHEAYGQSYTATLEQEYLEKLLGHETIDFGVLSESFQTDLVERVKSGEFHLPTPPWHRGIDTEQLQKDQRIIQERYNQKAYGENLYALYQTILESNHTASIRWIAPDQLIQTFLKPSQFTFLRV